MVVGSPLAATARGSHGAPPSQPVERTPNAKPAAVQDVQVAHRRAHVRMPEQFLHSSNVMAGLEQVCRK